MTFVFGSHLLVKINKVNDTIDILKLLCASEPFLGAESICTQMGANLDY
jgi:hypothetical protein